jgi:hypothetical protein
MSEAALNQPVTVKPAPVTHPPAARPLTYWLVRFLACNPFYLVSAALLLFGVYRVSVDPSFLKAETAQLIFNFASLQFYELLLVVTAIFLARRRIWYDSTLLVSLENLLVLVPFILISQAALIDPGYVWVMCLAGCALAIVRFGGLKRFVAELNFPVRLLGIGLAVLLVNAALPLIYRDLHEFKVGTKPTWGAAYEMNELAWLLLLPAVCALANFLPRAKDSGSLPPQHRWLPAGMFLLWLGATSVHLYSLGYVYDFDLRSELLAPALWVLSWTIAWSLPNFTPVTALARRALLIPPALLTLLAATQTGNAVFLLLSALNVMLFAGVAFLERGNRLALHLCFASVVALVAGMPAEWVRPLLTDFSRGHAITAAITAYFLLCAALSSNPRLGIFGAVVAGIGIGALLDGTEQAAHWAVQGGAAFLLLHSLRWDDTAHAGARAFRLFTAAGWVLHSLVWLNAGGMPWMVCAIAAIVLAGYLGTRLLRGDWASLVVPVAAVLVVLSGPGESAAGRLHAIPVGLLAVLGSFVLLGLGTLAALTKRHWNNFNLHEPEAPNENET